MSTTASTSAALPIASATLRILIFVNWLSSAIMLALLFVLPNRQWIMSAFDLSPSPDAETVIMGMRAIAAVGLAAVPVNYFVLRRLRAMVETVRTGDPFVAANAPRLCDRQLCSLCSSSAKLSARSPGISTPSSDPSDAGFSTINSWRRAPPFLLARVFTVGAMREDSKDG
jgi:uncharacterized membrane protein YcjF (UPF0283 family)